MRIAVAVLLALSVVPAQARYRHAATEPPTVFGRIGKAVASAAAGLSGAFAAAGASATALMAEARVALPYGPALASYGDGEIVLTPGGCSGWRSCGCIASAHAFGHPVPGLYLAAAWGKFPPASPAPGMAAWRPGHVFIIERVIDADTVVAYDGNSGGAPAATRIHPVSLRGYRVVNPHG